MASKRDIQAALTSVDQAMTARPGTPYCSIYVTRKQARIIAERLRAALSPSPDTKGTGPHDC